MNDRLCIVSCMLFCCDKCCWSWFFLLISLFAGKSKNLQQRRFQCIRWRVYLCYNTAVYFFCSFLTHPLFIFKNKAHKIETTTRKDKMKKKQIWNSEFKVIERQVCIYWFKMWTLKLCCVSLFGCGSNNWQYYNIHI